jgi:hypothetical protein
VGVGYWEILRVSGKNSPLWHYQMISKYYSNTGNKKKAQYYQVWAFVLHPNRSNLQLLWRIFKHKSLPSGIGRKK